MANTNNQVSTVTYEYTNETFGGCDMVASISISDNGKTYNKIIGELQTVSYSIHMEKRPVRSIGNVNAKDYVMGPRTIAGSLVFSVFNKHFSQDLVNNINAANTAGTVFLVDELPPFDLIISAANEYGYRSRLAIYGIRLLNEGQVMSVNDVYTENTYQFFATDMEYLTDEMLYTRSASDKKYKLTDSVPYTPDYRLYTYYNAELDKEEEDKQKAYWAKREVEAITLTDSVKQPTRSNDKGIVEFFLSPGQKSGVIYATDSVGVVTKINVSADLSNNSNNTTTYASSIFYPETYVAYFENDSGTQSNKVKFTIKKYSKSGTKPTSAPVIDKITSKSVKVYSSNSNHDKVLLSSLYDDYLETYSINNQTCKISGLSPDTSYSIRTYNSSDNESSATIQFTTLSDYKAYTELINYLKANKTTLGLSNVEDYINIIDENKNPDFTPAEAILKAKSSYQNQLSMLDLGDDDYKSKKSEIEEKISLCSTIISIALKMNTDLISAINKKNNVPAPTMFLDQNYDNIFQFDENIASAEFFREYGEVVQFASSIESYNFKTINNKSNCFRFLGKPGITHYVQAVVNNVRSSKVEFYVMTQAEKQEYINKQIQKDKLSSTDITKLNAIVHNDLTSNISTLDEQRAFLINAKKIEDDKIMAPAVLSIDENITVQTFLSNFSSNTNNFYLAIATYEDVVNNNDIYKIPFTSSNETVTISPLFNGIKENNAYALWIENSDCVQISNATSFSYIPGTEASDNITSYETKSFIKIILDIASEELPIDVQETIQGTIENNEGITSNMIISSVIDIVTNSVISKNTMLNFLYRIKSYIGIFTDPTESFINNINYNVSSISFNSLETGSILIYDLDKIKNIKLNNTNTISVNDYDSNILVVIAIDNSLSNKSNILVISKSDKYMEVL